MPPSPQQRWATKMSTFVPQVSLPSIFLAIFTGKLFLFYYVFSFSGGGGIRGKGGGVLIGLGRD